MKQKDEEESVAINIPECSIAFEQINMAPNETVISKKGIDIKGMSLDECRKHFDEIWNMK